MATGRSAVEGWRVLVTGASSGIGEATARALAERGARLAVAGRNADALAAVARSTGGVAVPGDLTLPGQARATVAAAVSALGGLDLLVSNAGAGWTGPFADMPPAAIDGLLDVNLRAAAHLVHAALPHLRAAAAACGPDSTARPAGPDSTARPAGPDSTARPAGPDSTARPAGAGRRRGRRRTRCQPGRVVLMGSIAGEVGVPGEAWYSATKAGLAGFAAALRAELEPEGVSVSLVVPGVVATRFLERRAEPYERSRPRPVPAARVASTLLAAVERGVDEAVVPAWLAIPARLHGGLPRLYRVLAARLA